MINIKIYQEVANSDLPFELSHLKNHINVFRIYGTEPLSN